MRSCRGGDQTVLTSSVPTKGRNSRLGLLQPPRTPGRTGSRREQDEQSDRDGERPARGNPAPPPPPSDPVAAQRGGRVNGAVRRTPARAGPPAASVRPPRWPSPSSGGLDLRRVERVERLQPGRRSTALFSGYSQSPRASSRPARFPRDEDGEELLREVLVIARIEHAGAGDVDERARVLVAEVVELRVDLVRASLRRLVPVVVVDDAGGDLAVLDGRDDALVVVVALGVVGEAGQPLLGRRGAVRASRSR